MVDKKLLKFISLFYSFAVLYALVNALLQKYAGISFSTYGYGVVVLSTLFNYLTKFIFIFFSVILARYLIFRKIKLLYSIFIHTLMSIVLSIFSTALLLTHEKYILGYEGDITFEIFSSRVAYGSTFNFFIYFTIITIVHAYYYLQKQKENELKRSNLKTQLLDSKINALQSQLQPHFLFNALNDISSLMSINIEKSQNAIADLSDMLRLTLGIKNSKLIPVKDELKILKKYLSIEEIRFDKKLIIEIDVDENVLSYKIPPLILQPLVENSIKHGFSYENDNLKVKIGVHYNKGFLIVKVFNDGKLLNNETPTYGNGISNILLRLDTLFPNQYSFEFSNNKYLKGVQTIIKIPSTLLE